MATSSILTNFTISDKNTAQAFVEALDAASREPEWKPKAPIKAPVTDHDAIKALLAKRKR